MPKIPDEPFDNELPLTPMQVAEEALAREVKRVEDNPMPPRFVPTLHPLARYQGELWIVVDTQLNLTVFHWSGRTAQEKANVVAQALNALGHMYE